MLSSAFLCHLSGGTRIRLVALYAIVLTVYFLAMIYYEFLFIYFLYLHMQNWAWCLSPCLLPLDTSPLHGVNQVLKYFEATP